MHIDSRTVSQDLGMHIFLHQSDHGLRDACDRDVATGPAKIVTGKKDRARVSNSGAGIPVGICMLAPLVFSALQSTLLQEFLQLWQSQSVC